MKMRSGEPIELSTGEVRTMMWGNGWFGLVFMVLFWALLVAGVVWLIRGLASGGDRDQARRILDERFASGEISAQEYEERRGVLK